MVRCVQIYLVVSGTVWDRPALIGRFGMARAGPLARDQPDGYSWLVSSVTYTVNDGHRERHISARYSPLCARASSSARRVVVGIMSGAHMEAHALLFSDYSTVQSGRSRSYWLVGITRSTPSFSDYYDGTTEWTLSLIMCSTCLLPFGRGAVTCTVILHNVL